MLCKLIPTLKSWAEGGGDVLCGASDPFILLPLERPSCMLLSSILSVLPLSSTKSEMSHSFLLSILRHADSKVWVTHRFTCPSKEKKTFSSAQTQPEESWVFLQNAKLVSGYGCLLVHNEMTFKLMTSFIVPSLLAWYWVEKQCITGLEFLFNIFPGIK